MNDKVKMDEFSNSNSGQSIETNNNSENKKMHSNWEIYNFVATYILSVIAILGFCLSIYTANEATKTANETAKSLASFEKVTKLVTTPFVRIQDYMWTRSSPVITCEDPPTGVFVYVQNNSMFPVEVLNEGYKFYYGERLLNNDVVETVGSKLGQILPPGHHISYGITSETISKYLKNKTDLFDRLGVNVIYSANIRNLLSDEMYSYEAKVNFGYDCRQPRTHKFTFEYEKLNPVPLTEKGGS